MNSETQSFIKGMEKAGRLAAETLIYVKPYLKVGITTDEINTLVHDYTLTHEATPAPLGYKGFPKSVCTSVNDCICHGVPGGEVLKEGDVINVDVTCILNGYHGDTSATFYIGDVDSKVRDLTKAAYEAMHKGIEQIQPKNKTGNIGFAIDKFVSKKGFFAVKEIGGHGIGQVFHDEPFVPSYGKKGKGDALKPWSCITVEPMLNFNSKPYTEFDIPNSDIKYYLTADKTASAQFEHTVLITDTGYEVMTLSGEEVFIP